VPETTTIEPVRESELGAAGRMVARACQDDPCFSYVFPDPAERPRQAESFFSWSTRHGHLFGEVSRAGSIDGVMVVYRSDDTEQPSEQEQLEASDFGRVGQELGDEPLQRLTAEFFDRIFATASGALHEHLDHGYWELDLLAVDPARQGQGVGSSLLDHLHERADKAGKQVGLITFNPRNLPLYERHGYTVVAHDSDQPSGVLWWSMRRLAETA
jgi:GNAT superfamily N-acetyltransferase